MQTDGIYIYILCNFIRSLPRTCFEENQYNFRQAGWLLRTTPDPTEFCIDLNDLQNKQLFFKNFYSYIPP